MHQHILINTYILTNLIKCSKYGHWPFVDPLDDQKLAQCSKNIHLAGFKVNNSTQGILLLAPATFLLKC